MLYLKLKCNKASFIDIFIFKLVSNAVRLKLNVIKLRLNVIKLRINAINSNSI